MHGTTVITGATSGIGASLAKRFAAPDMNLALAGRNTHRLAAIGRDCQKKGASVTTGVVDVTDRSQLAEWLMQVDQTHPVDRIIANAGLAVDESNLDTKAAATYRVIDVNLIGVLNTVLPLLPAMKARGRGQLLLLSSLCAWAPLPDTPAYSASKAALLAFGLALREELLPHGLRVCIACPGFVQTGMAIQYLGWRPSEISSDDASEIIARGLERNEAVIAFPRHLAWASRLQAFLPERLRRWAGRPLRFRIEPKNLRRQN